MTKDCHFGSAQRFWVLVSLRFAQTVATDVCPLASGCSPIGTPRKIWRCLWAEMLKIAPMDKSQLAMERNWFVTRWFPHHKWEFCNVFMFWCFFSIVPFVACHCSLPTGLWIDASTICFQPFDDWFYGPILSEERREDIAAPWLLVDATRVPETKALDFRGLYHFEYVSIQYIDLIYPGFWCMWTANFVCSCIRMPSQQNLKIRLVFFWRVAHVVLPNNGRSSEHGVETSRHSISPLGVVRCTRARTRQRPGVRQCKLRMVRGGFCF
jgi:hypothetical protein